MIKIKNFVNYKLFILSFFTHLLSAEEKCDEINSSEEGYKILICQENKKKTYYIIPPGEKRRIATKIKSPITEPEPLLKNIIWNFTHFLWNSFLYQYDTPEDNSKRLSQGVTDISTKNMYKPPFYDYFKTNAKKFSNPFID